jgi:hypothetical protein
MSIIRNYCKAIQYCLKFNNQVSRPINPEWESAADDLILEENLIEGRLEELVYYKRESDLVLAEALSQVGDDSHSDNFRIKSERLRNMLAKFRETVKIIDDQTIWDLKSLLDEKFGVSPQNLTINIAETQQKRKPGGPPIKNKTEVTSNRTIVDMFKNSNANI